MTLATLSDQKARLLMRIRWLAWGAIVILIAADFAVADARPAQSEIPPHELTATHAGGGCGCTRNTETI